MDPHTDSASESVALSTSLGGRVRKMTQMFTFTQTKSDDSDVFAPPMGKGTKVREITFVASNIEALGKKQMDMIKQLYSIMYGRRFQQKNVKMIKEHILDFSGIIDQDEKAREQLLARMGKWKLAFVNEVLDILAVDRSKKSFEEEGKPHNKESLLDRLVDWLYNPQTTKLAEKKAAIVAKKEKQKLNKRTRKTKAAKKSVSELGKKKRKPLKKKSSVNNEKDEDECKVIESEGEDSSSDFEEGGMPTKKRKVVSRSKKSRVVQSDGDDDHDDEEMSSDKDEKQSIEKEPIVENKLAIKTREPVPDTKGSDESTDKAKTSDAAGKDGMEPELEDLDADMCSKVRDIIARGNAEELTVKKIVRQLSSDLGRDMSAQKKAIKEFIQAEI